MGRISKTYSAVCSAEIQVHLIIFFLIVAPVTAIVIPSIILYFIFFGVTNLAVLLNILNASAKDFASDSWTPLFTITIVILFFLIFFLVFKKYKLSQRSSNGIDRKLKDVPDTTSGQLLIAEINRIWKRFGLESKPPKVSWFVNFNVLARAVQIGSFREIQISNGLWERVIKKHAISDIILTHEIAHLVYRDIPRFLLLEALVQCVRKIIKMIFWLGFATAFLFLLYELVNDIRLHENWPTTLRHLTGVPFVAGLLLVTLPLGEMVIRRYAGFVISLIELRADISAAQWLGSFQHVSESLESDRTLHTSSFADLGRSLISLNLTHISETERINILKSNDRLITPKIRYFLFSVILVLLFPINSITPLLWGGALDHLLVMIVIIALYIAFIVMLYKSPLESSISWRRSGILGILLFFFIGLSTIDFYEIGYFLTYISASFFPPNGFTDKPITLPEFQESLQITLKGLIGQFKESYYNLATIFVVPIFIICVRVISILCSKLRTGFAVLTTLVVVAMYATIVACYDEFRSIWYENVILSPAQLLADKTQNYPQVRFLLPIVCMTISVGLINLFEMIKLRYFLKISSLKASKSKKRGYSSSSSANK